MAGFHKIYMIGGQGGFLGSDGINPIGFQILVGNADREWLEVKYFDEHFQSIAGITHMVPLRPINDENIINGIIMFGPQLFMQDCDLLKDAFKHFKDLGKKKIDMGIDQPDFWNELVDQAQSKFQNINLYSADIKDLRPISF